ncbi:hypothetical protein [Rubripirellula obstinata]|uniref:hypothetical protein n=1 Tax=Rubripirellula obstinata TaxID=406547 RepID=UPI00082B6C84|nr:hypothetical protein [Rubripirellula obstinata]
MHSIDFCPICGGGLCGIRIIGSLPADSNNDDSADSATATASATAADAQNSSLAQPHGLVICDECEAIWLEPDVSTVHQYPDLEKAASPVNGMPIWGDGSRWASMEDIEWLGWTEAVNPELDAELDADSDSEEKLV